jgi:hypothetical protein
MQRAGGVIPIDPHVAEKPMTPTEDIPGGNMSRLGRDVASIPESMAGLGNVVSPAARLAAPVAGAGAELAGKTAVAAGKGAVAAAEGATSWTAIASALANGNVEMAAAMLAGKLGLGGTKALIQGLGKLLSRGAAAEKAVPAGETAASQAAPTAKAATDLMLKRGADGKMGIWDMKANAWHTERTFENQRVAQQAITQVRNKLEPPPPPPKPAKSKIEHPEPTAEGTPAHAQWLQMIEGLPAELRHFFVD